RLSRDERQRALSQSRRQAAMGVRADHRNHEELSASQRAMILIRQSTTLGSYTPLLAPREISSRAMWRSQGSRYGRQEISASYASATATIREPSGMSSPLSPSG